MTTLSYRHASSAILILAALVSGCRSAQTRPAESSAPVAASADTRLPESPTFDAAVSRGTRTRTGRPGPRYWQQWARYTITAELQPANGRVTGSQTVRYFNRSPDRLDSLAVHLYQNLYSAQRPQPGMTASKGMELSRIAAQGQVLTRSSGGGPGYSVDGTIGWLRLPRPLAAGDSVDLEMAWQFTVMARGGTREGHDEEVYFLGYWYPQLAVYDDVGGWQVDQYLGQAEFYMGYADYDVSVTLPNGWIVAATGALRDSAVFAPFVRERLAGVRRAGSQIVHVVTAPERGTATVRSPDGKLTWRFDARNVRHVVVGASARFLMDAANAAVGDRDGDGRADTTSIFTYYRPEAPSWVQSARYTRHSIEFMSRLIFPYEYPHMSAIQGLEGGMEYPMITLITAERDTLELLATIEHEVAHMWFPMMVGSDEKRHAWMDEGLSQYNGSLGERDLLGGDASRNSVRSYTDFARSGQEEPLLRHGDRYQSYAAYATASYDKPLAMLRALEGLLGRETFLRAFRDYGNRWKSKHPMPMDLFNTFNDVSGQDLSWFWRTWVYETWRLDQAIAAVRDTSDMVEIDIENRGSAAMPARVVITRADGSTQRVEVPVSVWTGGATRHTLRVAKSPAVRKVEIDPEEYFPDVNRRNQRWER